VNRVTTPPVTESDDTETNRLAVRSIPAIAAPSAPIVLLTDQQITEHCSMWLDHNLEPLIQLRRYIHSHPELSGAEHGTAALIAERLSAAGLTPRLIPAGNGVLVDIGPERPGAPVIALRADLDALPLPDLKDAAYRSTVPDVCHACGHDVHTTVMAGTALALAALGDALPGRVRVLFQPSEESQPCGSHDLISAGAMEGVGQIFALHCYPELPAGQVGLKVGPLTGACDMARVRLTGGGGHTARPHLSVDLVGALGRIVSEVPGLLARRFDTRSALVTVFGTIHAGVAANVMPGSGSVAGTVRTLDTDVWLRLPEVFEEVVRQVVAPTGAHVEVEYNQFVPPVENDAHAISVLTAAAHTALGPDAVQPAQHSLGGEDFSWYLRHAPGAMARLGTGLPGRSLDLHRGDFDVDEAAIGAGVRLMVHTVLEAMRRERA
jgi:amidohydrolase